LKITDKTHGYPEETKVKTVIKKKRKNSNPIRMKTKFKVCDLKLSIHTYHSTRIQNMEFDITNQQRIPIASP
jgi:hypothetical protein